MTSLPRAAPRLATALLLLTLACVPSCAQAPRAPDEGELTIFHTNDIHGGFLLSTVEGKNGGPPMKVGGFLALDAWLRAHRAEYPNSLLLDAGDLMTGNPICEIEVEGVRGLALADMMNVAGYDGIALGNHDFDDGLANTQALVKRFAFPVLCANVKLADGTPVAPEAYHIYEVGPFRVGVIGLLMDGLDRVVPAETMEKLTVEPTIEVAKRLVERIDPETDVIILLTHQGLDMDRVLARSLGPDVDLIVGGHSHTKLTRPEKENGVLIVQAGSSLDAVGRITLQVKDDKVVSFDGELIPLEANELEPSPEMKALVDRMETEVRRLFGTTLGTLETDWRRNYYGESNLGNFVADALREKFGADFACINSGSLRKNLVAGPITLLDVYEIYPFTNPVVTFEVTGEQLLGILRHNAISAARQSHGILQVSGVRYRYATDSQEGAILLEATVGGQPIDPKRTYKAVSGNFIVADKAEKYLGYRVEAWVETGTHVRAVIEEAIRLKKTVKSLTEGRIDGR